ncbi:MAG: hypothetical protein AB1772_11945, partial [Candidatus Zixiibacteriota bacterium]
MAKYQKLTNSASTIENLVAHSLLWVIWRFDDDTTPPLRQRIPEGRRVFWQKRCYDHNCRSIDATIEKINYCH